MDVTVTIVKPSCGHVFLTYHSGSKSTTRTYMLDELKASVNPEDIDEAVDMIHVQIKKTCLDNPTATLAQLKTIIEAEVYKI